MNQETVNGRGYFRKSKAFGLVCGIALAGSFAISSHSVNADVVTATTPSVVASATTSSSTATTASTTSTDAISTSVPEGTTQDEAKTTIDTAQSTLQDTATKASDAGVTVTTGDTTEVTINKDTAVDTTNQILTDLNDQNTAVTNAIAKQQANDKAYADAKTNRDTAVSQGQSDLSHSTANLDAEIKVADQNNLSVTTDTADYTPKYVDTTGLTGDALTQAMSKNIALYTAAVQKGVALQDQSTADMKQKIADYLKAMSDYKQGLTDTGLKWQNGVTLEVQAGATAMSGSENVVDFGDGSLKTAAMYATQGTNLDQNADANFDNIFKIDGSGTILVRNTTNGDVKLTFSNINAPYNSGTYVAIWGDNNGGIAWSVFALYTGNSTGGAGETAGGSGSTNGRILDYVYSYDGHAETTKGVSVVTFNDIDDTQVVSMVSGLDGSTISTGANISQTGNDFSAGSGDVSQGSTGVLGTNGVRWVFDSAKTVSFDFHHVTNTKASSIVAGIFGASSEIPKEPIAPILEAHKATVSAPKQADKPQNQEVTVHYYDVKTTPVTPETPTPVTPTAYTPQTVAQAPVVESNVLPSTGDSDKGSALVMLGGLILASFGLINVRKRKFK